MPIVMLQYRGGLGASPVIQETTINLTDTTLAIEGDPSHSTRTETFALDVNVTGDPSHHIRDVAVPMGGVDGVIGSDGASDDDYDFWWASSDPTEGPSNPG